jgi:SAM-dependent methyltransferase
MAMGFQSPRHIDDVSRCYFYHTVDLPDGTHSGDWDLRADIEAYIGRYPYAGQRVVDIGTASGFVAFEMEKRGAEVVALDFAITENPTSDMGLIPYGSNKNFDEMVRGRIEGQRALQASFWYMHERLGSHVRYYEGDAQVCPEELRPFDVAFFGSILLHLRDPLGVVSAFGRHARQAVIITEPFENAGHLEKYAVAILRASADEPTNVGTWWYLTPKAWEQFLRVLGYSHFSLTRHSATFVKNKNKVVPHYTLVATR